MQRPIRTAESMKSSGPRTSLLRIVESEEVPPTRAEDYDGADEQPSKTLKSDDGSCSDMQLVSDSGSDVD
eukprot:279115-Rhodomonas_salina.1